MASKNCWVSGKPEAEPSTESIPQRRADRRPPAIRLFDPFGDGCRRKRLHTVEADAHLATAYRVPWLDEAS